MKLSKAALVIALSSSALFAQSGLKDPGPRGGTANAGSYYKTLNSTEQQIFNNSKQQFEEVDSVSGTIENGKGLGPTFNGNSCAQCHAQPAVGGSSPGLASKQNPIPNPQVELATLDGAHNQVPFMISEDGPVREVRDRVSDGVVDLYTIAGRSDAQGCNLAQPDFRSIQNSHGVSFRIPTPLFGLGLVETTPDYILVNNLNSTASQRKALGINGRFNTSGNDGTITRFGWKAQNKSLLIFSGEAYNVEQGVTNELFTNERVSSCLYNGTPEDNTGADGLGTNSDVTAFALFGRLLDPPSPIALNSDTTNGSKLFISIGCANCHSQTLQTGKSVYTGMSNAAYHPYSDFALHHMGSGLADFISQGNAAGDEFRTAPLWGIGQRLFFLHDGRTSDLAQAIVAHGSSSGNGFSASEANTVINNFNKLTTGQKQSLLDFLRSL